MNRGSKGFEEHEGRSAGDQEAVTTMRRMADKVALKLRSPFWQRTLIAAVLGLLIVLGVSVGLAVLFDAQEEETLRLAATANLTLDQATVNAKAVTMGTAIEGDLTVRHGRTVYLIDVLGDEGHLHRVAVDAETGSILGTEQY